MFHAVSLRPLYSVVLRCQTYACLPTNRARESPELQDRPARRRTALSTARRYASAVHAVVMCPSVCPSVGQKPELYPKRLEESSCHGGFLPPVPRCVIKKIWVSPKIRVLPSGTLSQTLDLENFDPAIRSRCQRNSLTVKPFDDTLYDSRRVVAVYYTSVSCNSLTPLL